MHVFLGNALAHHPRANTLLSLVNWLSDQLGCTFGFLGESANTVGAQWVQARPSPQSNGLNVSQMLEPGALKGVLLMNLEPEHDCANPQRALQALTAMDLVVTLSPFKTNLEFSDVILPIAPFSETPGTFVNTQGMEQSFHAVVRPLGGTRPAWKVLRVLANMLGLHGFEFETIEDVRVSLHETLPALSEILSNHSNAALDLSSAQGQKPCTAASYQLDGLVRRSPALQATADARMGR
jgi:NADH-quinone oxidoreductase subunit G